MAIDTLAYAKTLEAAGDDRRVAEAHAEAIAGFAIPDLTTKNDIELLKGDILRLAGKWTVLMWAVGINVALTIAIFDVLLRVH